MNHIKTHFPVEKESLPVHIHFDERIQPREFVAWKATNDKFIKNALLRIGGILISGIGISSASDFEQATQCFAPKFLSYIDGNSPRTKLSSCVYTSTEYDPAQYITLHNELSYSNKWPSHIYFGCLHPAETGGETPIADCRRIMARMNQDLVDEIERKRIRYVRNLHGGQGFGPSWQHTFETQDRKAVENICKEREIHFKWNSDGGIQLVHVRDGIVRHSVTGEKVWFNQIDQFHPSHLPSEIYEALTLIYQDTDSMPMNVTFGDGTPITTQHVHEIRSTIDQVEVPVAWNTGDLLILDNVLACHGRRPYTGYRKVLVSMS